MSTTQDLDSFIDTIIAAKPDFSTLDPEVREQIKKDLLERAEARINATILANIPAGELEAFNALADTGTDVQMQEFCTAHIPDLPNLIAGELLAFRNTYLA